jgi:putative ABC transport system permease protein
MGHSMMESLRTFLHRLKGSFRKNRAGDEVQEELQSHLELLVQENLSKGMDPESARRAARLALGGETQIKEAYRHQAGLPFLEVLMQDLRYGFRHLRKNPTFTFVAVLTLALGIGANTAIFSVVNAVLLRPLPYAAPDRLISLHGGQSWPDLNDIREQTQTLQSIGAYWSYQFDLLGNGEPEQIQSALISLDFFDTLGVPPLMGRSLTAKDDAPGAPLIAVVSESFWRNHLGAAPNVIGRTLQLSGNTFEIVGVMPKSFWLPTGSGQYSGGPEIFVPMRLGYPEAATARGLHAQRAIARLKDGVSISQAQSDLDAIATRLSQLYPAENRDRRFIAESFQEAVVGKVRTTILVLFASVGLLLLIASLNFANLLLAKASSRREETQIRAALGASAGRLIRQALTESVLISVIGGVAGLLLASLLQRLLVFLKPGDLPRLESVSLDPSVLVFALALTFLTGCAFGLIPAFRVVIPNSRSLYGGKGSVGQIRSTARLRNGLIIAEFAVALVLLCGAGLLLRSLWRLQSVDPGFDAQDVWTARIALEAKKYEKLPVQNQFFAQLDQRLHQIPDAKAAALVSELPLAGNVIPHNIVFHGRPPVPEGSEPDVLTNLVSPTYFSALRIPVIKGRNFEDSDRAAAPLVAVINQSMVREFFPSEDPLGKQLAFARMPGPPQWFTIVGVVADIREYGPDQDQGAAIYMPVQQKITPWRRWSGIIVRGAPGARLDQAIKQAVWSIDATVPVTKIQPLSAMMSDALSRRKFTTLLLVIFAFTALTLAMVGIYGVIAYSVVQRTSEIGVRIALGAQRFDVLWMVLRHAVIMGLIGIGLGTVGSFYATRALDTLVFGITSRDPATFAAVAILLLVVAFLAALVPAWRATRIDPSSALRAE